MAGDYTDVKWGGFDTYVTTTMGIGSAGASVISAAGQIATSAIQYKTAKAMLESQERIANRDFNFQMLRFDNAEALTSSIENIQKVKNEAMIGNAEVHRDKALAEARLTEHKKDA